MLLRAPPSDCSAGEAHRCHLTYRYKWLAGMAQADVGLRCRCVAQTKQTSLLLLSACLEHTHASSTRTKMLPLSSLKVDDPSQRSFFSPGSPPTMLHDLRVAHPGRRLWALGCNLAGNGGFYSTCAVRHRTRAQEVTTLGKQSSRAEQERHEVTCQRSVRGRCLLCHAD